MSAPGWKTLTVPARLHRELKTAAAQDGQKLGDVVCVALAQWLDQRLDGTDHDQRAEDEAGYQHVVAEGISRYER